METVNDIGQLVVRTLFDVAIILVLLRLLLQLFRADFYNPISQTVVRATAFLDPLRKVLGARGGLDITTLVALVALKMTQLAVLYAMVHGATPGPVFLLATSGLSLVSLLLKVFFWSIIGSVVVSWLAPDGRSPATQLLWSLTEPLLAPARRLLPPLGGLDFSPIIVLLLINILDDYGVPALAGLVQRALF